MARILFGDDDPEQLCIFQLLLESEGHHLILAAAPAEVFDRLENAMPDLLIVDLRFPTSADGRSLIRRIRDAGCLKPIIVLSGWPEDIFGYPEEELVSNILVKPVPVPELLQMIETLTR